MILAFGYFSLMKFFIASVNCLVLRPLKILAGLLIYKCVLLRHLYFAQGNELPLLVLFPAADPDIAVNLPVQGSTSLLIEMILE